MLTMDEAQLIIEAAIKKAEAIGQPMNSQPGDQFFGIHASNHGRVMIFAVGIPIKVNGQIVGAIGVSGGSGEQDQAVAEAAAAACS
jgi:uncharacterized protein GlcG (DUF336 family)